MACPACEGVGFPHVIRETSLQQHLLSPGLPWVQSCLWWGLRTASPWEPCVACAACCVLGMWWWGCTQAFGAAWEQQASLYQDCEPSPAQ